MCRRLRWRTGGWRAMRRAEPAGCSRAMWMWMRRIRLPATRKGNALSEPMSWPPCMTQGPTDDDKNIPIYLTLMAPYTAGLPYDFDQVRVFTWNLKMHRYETAYRDKNIEGYLPVRSVAKTLTEKRWWRRRHCLRLLTKCWPRTHGPVVPDTVTGPVTPGRTIAKTCRLEGNLVRRILQPGTPADGVSSCSAPRRRRVWPRGRSGRRGVFCVVLLSGCSPLPH